MARKKFHLFPQRFGAFPYVWLLYLLMPAFNLQTEHGWKLLAGAGMLVLFAVTYHQLYWAGSGKAFHLWLGLQILLIVVLSVFYTPYNFYLGFYTANFIGWYTDKKTFRLAYALFALSLLIPLLIAVQGMELEELVFLVPFLLIMLVFPFGIRSLTSNRMLERKLDQANEVIREMVKREERMRIARDLHDTMGHTLSLITLKSQLVEKLAAKDPERAQAEAREIQRTSRAALRQVRELVSEMRAVSVAEELAEAGEMLRAAEIVLDVEGDVSLEGVSDLSQNILSLCIKEAVTNIVKHSGADRCRISLEMPAGKVRISIEDNGTGLRQAGGPGGEHRAGNGLKGMAERLSLIEGSVTLNAGERKGTVLTVVIPRIVKEGVTA